MPAYSVQHGTSITKAVVIHRGALDLDFEAGTVPCWRPTLHSL